MNKNLLSLVVVAAVSAAYCFNQAPVEKPSALTIDNIEALTGEEQTHTMPCSTTPMYTGSWNNMVLDCYGCTFRPGYSGNNDSRCP